MTKTNQTKFNPMTITLVALSLAIVGFLTLPAGGNVAAVQAEEYERPAPISSPPVAFDHASTVAEGFLRGEADAIRSAGEFNYNTAAAAVLVEEARSRSYENEVSKAETYFQKRRLNEAYRAAQRAPRPDPKLMSRVSQLRAPKRLEESQINGPQGIYWPAALRAAEFDHCRQRLDALFAGRTPGNSGMKSESYPRIQKAAREMSELLSSNFKRMDQSEFLVAKKFVDGLAYEARFEIENDRVAAK